MISCKIQSCTFALINNFEILQVSIAFFSDTVWPSNLKSFLYINPYGYSMQTKFHVPRTHSFWEKCDDNLKLASHCSPILCNLGTWNFFCTLTHMDTLSKPNFMFLGHTVFEKNAMISSKIQSFAFALINNFEILQVSIAFFSDTVWPRNLKFFLCINPYGYSMQTKFHVPRSHSFWEKCDHNLKLASHCAPILCDRGTWNFFCILTHMDTLCKPNFMFLGHTVFEKNAMISCKNSKLHIPPNNQLWNFTSYHRIFFRYCVTEELEIFFVY